MNNLIAVGDTVTLTAPSGGVTAGSPVKIGALVGVPVISAAEGAQFPLQMEGIVKIAKTSAQAWTEGAKIYWDDSGKVATTTATSNTLIGAAVAVAANPSATGLVRLNGTVV